MSLSEVVMYDIQVLKYYPDMDFWKIAADKVIFSTLDLIGGSANIDTTSYLYRQHESNNFNTNKDYIQQTLKHHK